MAQKVKIVKNPDLDFFVGLYGGDDIPTKQDWYEKSEEYKFFLLEDDLTVKELDENDFYVKKANGNKLKIFREKFKNIIKENLNSQHPYRKPEKLEIIISVSMNEKRMQEVDIDNLSKAIIDCFNGLIFEDDSQIVSLLAFKDVTYLPVYGVLVGVRRLERKLSWVEGIKLAHIEPIDD